MSFYRVGAVICFACAKRIYGKIKTSPAYITIKGETSIIPRGFSYHEECYRIEEKRCAKLLKAAS